MKYQWSLWLLLLLIPVLSGCNDTDDVQKIFTGKTWKLTYITRKNDHSWYQFHDVDDKVYRSYDPSNGTRSFKIDFTGSTDDGIIQGDFSGFSSVNIKGTWRANGKNSDFATIVKSSSVVNPKEDTLGKYIIEGITKATTYDGDENNLYLYFEYKDPASHITETLCLAFSPNR